MEIAILTLPLGGNYGGVMQNWALQQILEELGHRPVTVDHWQMTAKCRRKMIFKHYKSMLLRRSKLSSRPLPCTVEKWRSNVRRFIKKHIRLTDSMGTVPQEFWMKNRFDLYLVGSDQVWRPVYNKDIGTLEMMFLKPIEYFPNKRRVAYAASFGTEEWEYDSGDEAIAKRLLPLFDSVSVREESGVRLCERYLGVKASCVLDPTLLVPKEKYSTLVPDSYRRMIPKGSAGIYILDVTEAKLAEAERICRTLGLQPYFVGLKDESGGIPPLEEWLAAFLECEYIITDSFHGVAFSINFNIPFTVMMNPDRGNARFTSLLGLVALENRTQEATAQEPIAWEPVNAAIGRLRQDSIGWLRNALSHK